jgi:hypothetical protein
LEVVFLFCFFLILQLTWLTTKEAAATPIAAMQPPAITVFLIPMVLVKYPEIGDSAIENPTAKDPTKAAMLN